MASPERTSASTSCPPITRWTSIEKATAVLGRSKRYLPDAVARQVDAFLTPENLAVLAGTLVIWAGSHFFGVGEVVDVGLLLVGSLLIGASMTGVVADLVAFGATTIHARSEDDLDRAARLFASAIVGAGVTTVFAILLRRSAAKLQGGRGPSIAQVARPRQPGLVALDPVPEADGLMAKPTVVGDPDMPVGQGLTTPYGDVTYSTSGSATERQLARLHELVHSFLSPRLAVFRRFRARLAMSAYARSAILKYLEEALAESFAQIRVNGLAHILTGIRFPVTNGYLTLQQLACEGAEIGKIVFGTERFSLQFIAGAPTATRSE